MLLTTALFAYLVCIPFAYLLLLTLFSPRERKEIVPEKLFLASIIFPLTFVVFGGAWAISYGLDAGRVHIQRFHDWAEKVTA